MTLDRSFYVAGIHYREELVKCGKPKCKRCPHGPYWYAYFRAGAFLKKRYVGKWLPSQLKDLVPPELRFHCKSKGE
jgi:hypothetical protein